VLMAGCRTTWAPRFPSPGDTCWCSTGRRNAGGCRWVVGVPADPGAGQRRARHVRPAPAAVAVALWRLPCGSAWRIVPPPAAPPEIRRGYDLSLGLAAGPSPIGAGATWSYGGSNGGRRLLHAPAENYGPGPSRRSSALPTPRLGDGLQPADSCRAPDFLRAADARRRGPGGGSTWPGVALCPVRGCLIGPVRLSSAAPRTASTSGARGQHRHHQWWAGMFRQLHVRRSWAAHEIVTVLPFWRGASPGRLLGGRPGFQGEACTAARRWARPATSELLAYKRHPADPRLRCTWNLAGLAGSLTTLTTGLAPVTGNRTSTSLDKRRPGVRLAAAEAGGRLPPIPYESDSAWYNPCRCRGRTSVVNGVPSPLLGCLSSHAG